jgi:hypothetical protein
MLRWIREIAQGGVIAVQALRKMLNSGAFIVDQTNEKIVALIATAVLQKQTYAESETSAQYLCL